MIQLEQLQAMNDLLLEDQPQYKEDASQFPKDRRSQRRLMRSLMNVRHPHILPKALVRMQDQILSEEREEKGIVDVENLPTTKPDSRIAIWQGDITRLGADAIVNAANSQLLGCFSPCHGCIDNAIHSAAGLQLREECAEIMRRQGHEEATGQAKITKGYNLPAKHVLHTVGPTIYGQVTEEDEHLLASCYQSCLELAAKEDLSTVAFCCISTGVFHFPNRRAAEIAVQTVQDFLNENNQIKLVIFNVFKDQDLAIYQDLLD